MYDKELDDIIFTGRNKDYGAFQLRKKSDGHSLIGFGVASFLVLFLFSFPILAELLSAEKEDDLNIETTKVLKYSELSAPPPIEIDRPPDPIRVPPKAKAVKYLAPVAKPDEEVPDDEIVPTQDDLADAAPAAVNIEGADSIVYDIEAGEVEEVVEEQPFTIVEVMPSFPGGEVAMFEFLGEHLTYPPRAFEVELQGRVYVSFIVDPTGKVLNAKVERGIGMDCDAEALRVVNMMPDWSPGRQGGRYVPVKYILPIAFVLE